MNIHRRTIKSLVLACGLAACSGSVGTGTKATADAGGGDGDSGGSLAPATVYLASTIGPSPPSSNTPCPFATVMTAVDLGTVEAGVSNGGSTEITCSVTSSGADFDVSADVVSASGSFSVTGKMPSSGSGTGITAALEFAPGGALVAYTGASCAVTLVTKDVIGPSIAPGRVWATVTCPAMMVPGQSGVCEGTMTFRLEDCAGSP